MWFLGHSETPTDTYHSEFISASNQKMADQRDPSKTSLALVDQNWQEKYYAVRLAVRKKLEEMWPNKNIDVLLQQFEDAAIRSTTNLSIDFMVDDLILVPGAVECNSETFNTSVVSPEWFVYKQTQQLWWGAREFSCTRPLRTHEACDANKASTTDTTICRLTGLPIAVPDMPLAMAEPQMGSSQSWGMNWRRSPEYIAALGEKAKNAEGTRDGARESTPSMQLITQSSHSGREEEVSTQEMTRSGKRKHRDDLDVQEVENARKWTRIEGHAV